MISEGTGVYIGIGSNIGDKIGNCRLAIEKMGQLAGCRVVACSSLFKTEPEGVAGQDWYINCASRLTTSLPPSELMKNLLAIEHAMGRKRQKRWEARIIDLDILLFGQQVIHAPHLVIPHPLMHKRRFVLEPLVQLAPEFIHPVLKVSIRHLLEELPPGPSVEPAGDCS
ncbi:MAG: 2-amino-4-hydroxy-6-hydroxymethyldihydropteridine diphosphokinase [Thermodesulfobacteriota bacterium]